MKIRPLDHLTCFLRNLYAGQEATVRTGHGTMDWFQIRKGVHQGCTLSPCLFNLYAEYDARLAPPPSPLHCRQIKNLQCRRCGFDPWVGKMPWRRKWQPTPVLLLGKCHGQRILVVLWSMGSQRVGHNWATSLSSAYLRLLIFLPAILIPACASSSPAFLMMYSA